MSTTEISHWISGPRFRAGFVVAYYLLAIVTGVFVLLFHGRAAFAADLVAGMFYMAVTALLYALSIRPSGRKER